MSGRQGEVDSVKSFAADAAGNEERARTGRQIMDLLRLNKLAEAQRLMGELTREKVTKALRAEEVDEDDVLAQKKAAAAADEAAPAESLEDLLTQERVLRRVAPQQPLFTQLLPRGGLGLDGPRREKRVSSDSK